MTIMARNPAAANMLADKQNELDERHIPIQQAGVSGLRYPIRVACREKDIFLNTVAEFELAVAIPAEKRGAHMSRFTEALHQDLPDGLTSDRLPKFVEATRQRLEAEVASVTLRFPFFLEKLAPVSKSAAFVDYEVEMRCESARSDGNGSRSWLRVVVPVTTLCPCSKAVSDHGAHSQRGYVMLIARPAGLLWPEDLIELVEQSASAEIFALLKRTDEKYVTEHAYENPRFCEDLAREVAVRCDRAAAIDAYRVKVRNVESIHNHDAFALIESGQL